MNNPRQSRSSLITLASAVLAMLLLAACNQSQSPTASPAAPQEKAAATAATTRDVYVIFEGPWAIVPDPKDANSILLLAPKTKTHHDLYVTASNKSTLAPGTYDLSLPPRTGSAAGTFDVGIFRTKIDPKNVQRVVDDKSSNRYAIRLPKPEAYLPASRHRSRVSATYPPEPATEKEYATAVSLRYIVSSLNGFSLAGTPDGGTFNPLLLQVETPTLHFVLDPSQPDDECNGHSRQTFHDLTALLALALYVDFPDNPSTCHDKDPQKARAVKAETRPASSLDRLVDLLGSNLGDVEEANVALPGADRFAFLAPRNRKTLALYLFGHSSADCMTPIIAADGPQP